MTERLNVRMGSSLLILFWTLAVFLLGIFIGAHWHPSFAHSFAIAVVASLFVVLHELASCLFWCSLTALWIGRRTGAFRRQSRRVRNLLCMISVMVPDLGQGILSSIRCG